MNQIKTNNKAFSRHKSENLKPTVADLLKDLSSTLLSRKRKPTSTEMDKYLCKPSVKLEDLGGMTEIITRIREIVEISTEKFSLFREMNISPPKGILLSGPSGCGKTTLALAIGGSYNLQFFKLNGTELISALSGESEKKINKLVEKVKESAPSVLFIDEIDSILGKTEKASKEMEKRIVAQMKTAIDSIGDSDGPVLIVGATSKLENIDLTLRNSCRFGEEIRIGMPSEAEREDILKKLVNNQFLEEKVDLKFISRRTPGYLAGDLKSLVNSAGFNAIYRIKGEDKKEINQSDFDLVF